MKRLALALTAALLAGCAGGHTALPPTTAVAPQDTCINQESLPGERRSQTVSGGCVPNIPPVQFNSTAMAMDGPQLPSTAAKCYDLYPGAGDVVVNCYDYAGKLVVVKELVQIGTIIPAPQHPNCFFAGIVKGGAILAPAQTIMQLVGLGKIALNPWPNLAWYIGNGVYYAYAGC